MQYRKIPRTGEELSALGFGCTRLPGKRGKIDENRAKTLLFQAIEKGVNYFDTAKPYHMGTSETFLGKGFEGRIERKSNRLQHFLPGMSMILPTWFVDIYGLKDKR